MSTAESTTFAQRTSRAFSILHVAGADGAGRRSRWLRRDLGAIVGDGATYNAMVGLGETYFTAFALFLGMGEVAAGLLTALPMLTGAVLQMASPWGVRRFGSYRRWVVLCAAAQAVSLIGLVFAEASQQLAGLLIFLAVTLYWAAGLGAGAAWNTWVEDLVPRPIRARFFAVRARFNQAGILIGFVAGGVALQIGAGGDNAAITFVGLFIVAAMCRFISAWFLSRQGERSPRHVDDHHLTLGQLAERLRSGASGRLLLFLFAMQVAVQTSGPFYTPYMFRELGFSFLQFTALIAIAYLAKVIMSPVYGRLVQTLGARRLLWLGGAGIAPIAGLWVFSDSFWYLLGVQFLSGASWAAYELAMFLMFFDTIPRRERTSLLSLYNLGNAVAMVIGALLGGAVLSSLGENRVAYLAVFGLSSIGRFSSLVLSSFVLPVSDAVGSGDAYGLTPDEFSADRDGMLSLPFPALVGMAEDIPPARAA